MTRLPCGMVTNRNPTSPSPMLWAKQRATTGSSQAAGTRRRVSERGFVRGKTILGAGGSVGPEPVSTPKDRRSAAPRQIDVTAEHQVVGGRQGCGRELVS